MNNYSITFVSLRAGTTYTVHIGGGTGNEIALKGAAQPFTTQEDDSDDMFTPIRTQSGYIRIVDDGYAADGVTAFDWTDLIPATGVQRPVTLTDDNSNVCWAGFMQTQNFGGTLYGNPQEREFPVQCQLSVLEGFDIGQSTNIVNFGELLYNLLTRAGTWTYVYFQGKDAIDDWLLNKVTLMNYVSDSGSGTDYDVLQALTDICAFFGWTLRSHGQDLWFTAADDPDVNWTFQRIQINDLYDLESAQPVTVSWQSLSIADFVDTDNEENYALGCHKVTVNADINHHNNILEIPMSEIEPLFVGKSVSHTSQGDIHTFTVNYYPTEYDNNLLSIDCYWDQDTINGRFVASEVYEGSLADKHNYNFSYGLYCYGLNVPFSEYCFKLVSKFPMNFDSGAITINGQVDMQGDSNDGTGNGYIVVCLKVGDLWWDGSGWVSTQSSFQIPIVSNKIPDNRVLTGPYISYNGHGIGVSNLGGIVEFYCLGSHSNGSTEGEQCAFRSLTFGFARAASLAPNTDANENTYVATNNSKFAEERTIDLVWASDNGNTQGYGLVMNPSGSLMTTLSYTTSSQGAGHTERPEQHLANRIVSYYAGSTKGMRVDLDTDNIGDVDPGTMATGDFYPISIGHEWRDDVTLISLLKIQSN